MDLCLERQCWQRRHRACSSQAEPVLLCLSCVRMTDQDSCTVCSTCLYALCPLDRVPRRPMQHVRWRNRGWSSGGVTACPKAPAA